MYIYSFSELILNFCLVLIIFHHLSCKQLLRAWYAGIMPVTQYFTLLYHCSMTMCFFRTLEGRTAPLRGSGMHLSPIIDEGEDDDCLIDYVNEEVTHGNCELNVKIRSLIFSNRSSGPSPFSSVFSLSLSLYSFLSFINDMCRRCLNESSSVSFESLVPKTVKKKKAAAEFQGLLGQ